MSPKYTVTVAERDKHTGVITIEGDFTAFAESALMQAYAEATELGAPTIILDFAKLNFMNSSGIGLLVTLLIRANRANQKLIASGLNDHYQQIFELTRLNEAFTLYSSVAEARARAL